MVSEILLRQTQAVQVDPVFKEFVAAYPTVFHLASADPRKLKELLRPLGMVRRAEELVNVAQRIVSDHSGQIPSEMDALLSLPGICEYIAGCVLSFAFGDSKPAVDVSIERVLSRLFDLHQGGTGRPDKKVLDAYVNLMATADDKSLHYAMIDLAHAVCRPHLPRCFECPLRSVCNYALTHVQEFERL